MQRGIKTEETRNERRRKRDSGREREMEIGGGTVSDWKLSEGKDDKAEKGKSNWRKGRGKDKEWGRKGRRGRAKMK